jgi:hypothetical protein
VQATRIAERAPWNAARLDGQALFPAGSDFPEHVDVFSQAMIVDAFNVDSHRGQRRCTEHRLWTTRARPRAETPRIAAAHRFAEVSLGILVALAIVAVWREEQRLFGERTGG